MEIWGRLGAMALLLAMVSSATSAAYTNHTVGGTTGWFFNKTTNNSATNYAAWAAKQTFNLGDFLIFNTNTNQTVVQTYSNSTYSSCNYDDSGNDTFVYSEPESTAKTLSIAVPLTQQGQNYFFSDADDGVQCVKGMKFRIDAHYGQGLPPNLNQPPPPPYQDPASAQNPSTPPAADENGGNQGETFANGGSLGVSSNVVCPYFAAGGVVALLVLWT